MEYVENEWRCGLSLAVSFRPSRRHLADADGCCKHKSEAPQQIQSRTLHWERWRYRIVHFGEYSMRNCSKQLYSISSGIIDCVLKSALHVITFEQRSGLHPFSREHTNRTEMQLIYNQEHTPVSGLFVRRPFMNVDPLSNGRKKEPTSNLCSFLGTYLVSTCLWYTYGRTQKLHLPPIDRDLSTTPKQLNWNKKSVFLKLSFISVIVALWQPRELKPLFSVLLLSKFLHPTHFKVVVWNGVGCYGSPSCTLQIHKPVPLCQNPSK